MPSKFQTVNLRGRNYLEVNEMIILKSISKEQGGRVELTWPKIGSSGGTVVKTVMNCQVQ